MPFQRMPFSPSLALLEMIIAPEDPLLYGTMLIALGMSVLSILVVVGWLIYKYASTHGQDDHAEKLFEASLMKEAHAASFVPEDVPVAEGVVIAEEYAVVSAGPNPGDAPEAVFAAAVITASATAETPERPTPTGNKVIARLQAAKVLTGLVGPLRTNNPELVGTIVEVRGGRRLVILESRPDREDFALDLVLRNYEGIVAPGPGEEPVFIRRLESYMGDFIGDLTSLS